MSKLFEDIKQSLKEIIAYERGEASEVIVHKIPEQKKKAD